MDVNTQNSVSDILNIFDNANTDLFPANRPLETVTASNVSVSTAAQTTGATLGNFTQPLTLTELFASSGTFSLYDENDNSQLETTSVIFQIQTQNIF